MVLTGKTAASERETFGSMALYITAPPDERFEEKQHG